MAGPSAWGSEKGTPSSMMSAPPASRPSSTSTVSSFPGKPAVTKETKTGSFWQGGRKCFSESGGRPGRRSSNEERVATYLDRLGSECGLDGFSHDELAALLGRRGASRVKGLGRNANRAPFYQAVGKSGICCSSDSISELRGGREGMGWDGEWRREGRMSKSPTGLSCSRHADRGRQAAGGRPIHHSLDWPELLCSAPSSRQSVSANFGSAFFLSVGGTAVGWVESGKYGTIQ